MKIVYLTFNVSIREPLIKVLEENAVTDFQVIDQVIAKSSTGEARFNTPVWPGYNNSIFMQFTEDDKARKIIQKIKDFNKNMINENEQVSVCSWTLDDLF